MDLSHYISYYLTNLKLYIYQLDLLLNLKHILCKSNCHKHILVIGFCCQDKEVEASSKLRNTGNKGAQNFYFITQGQNIF